MDENEKKLFNRIADALDKIAERLAPLPAIEVDLDLIDRDLKELIDLFPVPKKADKLTATLIPTGDSMIVRKAEAPMTVNIGVTGTTVVVETAAGVIVPTTGPILYASDNPAVATYNSDGTWAAVSAGVANMSQLDQTLGLTDVTALTVQAAAPPVADTLIGTLVPNPSKK